MRFVFVFFLGCSYYNPCVSADTVIDGLCLDGVDDDFWNVEQVSQTIQYTETALNMHGADIDLPLFLVQHNIGARVVDMESPELYSESCGGQCWGMQYANDLLIGDAIFDAKYWILSHEILHTVGQYYLASPRETNYSHSEPVLFIDWVCVDKEYDPNLTVEGIVRNMLRDDLGEWFVGSNETRVEVVCGD